MFVFFFLLFIVKLSDWFRVIHMFFYYCHVRGITFVPIASLIWRRCNICLPQLETHFSGCRDGVFFGLLYCFFFYYCCCFVHLPASRINKAPYLLRLTANNSQASHWHRNIECHCRVEHGWQIINVKLLIACFVLSVFGEVFYYSCCYYTLLFAIIRWVNRREYILRVLLLYW